MNYLAGVITQIVDVVEICAGGASTIIAGGRRVSILHSGPARIGHDGQVSSAHNASVSGYDVRWEGGAIIGNCLDGLEGRRTDNIFQSKNLNRINRVRCWRTACDGGSGRESNLRQGMSETIDECQGQS